MNHELTEFLELAWNLHCIILNLKKMKGGKCMGELLFCFGYGGSLIILGFITKGFVRKMEADIVSKHTEIKEEKVGM